MAVPTHPPVTATSAHRPGAQDEAAHSPAPVWLQRLSLAVLVVFCLYLGGLIAFLPWWKDMWDRNALLLQFPTLRGYLLLGPVRGLISGLGLVDMWIGISELIHYRDFRR